MPMYSEKRRPREGRAPCLGEPHRIRPSEGTGLPRHGPERFRCSWAEKAPLFFLPTCRSPPKPPSRSSLPSASCPHRSTSSGPAAFPASRHVTSLPRSLLQLGAASAGFLEGRGGRKWQRRRAEVGGRVRTRVVRRCRSHGGARRAAAGGPRAGAGAAGAGRPLHARGDQVGQPPGRWGRPCAEVPVLMAPCLLSYRAVLKKATALEYKIQRRALRKEDFINYIQVGCAD